VRVLLLLLLLPPLQHLFICIAFLERTKFQANNRMRIDSPRY
jgi:hypothetical protein